ncbi:MAG: hypothetical protein R6U98_26405 [Pirellulaceae bacterium]
MKPDALNPMPWAVEQPAKETANRNRVGIFVNELERIVAYLNRSQELQAIFGTPVSRSLVVVADNNDLRIEEAGRVPLSQEQTQVFLRVLEAAITDDAVQTAPDGHVREHD